MKFVEVIGLIAVGYVIGRVHEQAKTLKKIENGEITVNSVKGFDRNFRVNTEGASNCSIML